MGRRREIKERKGKTFFGKGLKKEKFKTLPGVWGEKGLDREKVKRYFSKTLSTLFKNLGNVIILYSIYICTG